MATERLITTGSEAVFGLISGDLKGTVKLLIQLAFSVRRCQEKCQELAEKVTMIHSSLVNVVREHERGKRFDEASLLENLEQFLSVVEDCVDLVKRYNKMRFLPRVFTSMFREDEFKAMDKRLNECLRCFSLSLNVNTAVFLCEFKEEVTREFMKIQQDLKMRGSDEAEQEAERRFAEMKMIVADQQEPEINPKVSGNVTVGETLFGGYIIAGTLLTDESGSAAEPHQIILVQCQEERKEAAILKRLSDHESIMRFYGTYSQDGGQSYLVLERPSAEMLTLDDLIAKREAGFTSNWRLKRQIALEIALSLIYAHLAGVVHKNIRSPNIFLTDDLHPKVFGFFQGRIKAEPSAKKWMSMEQIRWAAPEQLPKNRPQYNEQCDIYSLGVVLWEMITNDYPYANFNGVMKLLAYRTREPEAAALNFEEAQQVGELGKFCRISLDCMQLEPSMRPKLETVIHRLIMLVPEDMHN